MSEAGTQSLTTSGAGEPIFVAPDRKTLLATAALLEGGLVGLAFLLGWWWDEPPLKYFRWSWPDLTLSVAATAPLVIFIVLLERFPVGPLRQLRDDCVEVWHALLRTAGWWDILLFSALAGFCEELLFRGVLQPAIAYHLDKPLGILLAALLFGLAHPMSVTYVVVVFLIGIYLGLLHEATDNLLVVILVHGLYDFIAMAYLKRRFSQAAPMPSETKRQSATLQPPHETSP